MQVLESTVRYQPARALLKDGLMETLAQRLKSRRQQRGLTQADLASRVGIKTPQYNRYEKGADPRLELLLKIAKELQCSADYLIGLTDDPTERNSEESLPEDQQALIVYYETHPDFKRKFKQYLSNKELMNGDEFLQLTDTTNNHR